MKKYILATIGAVVLVSILIFTQIPAGNVEAKEDPEFLIQSGVLVSYTGNSSEVSIPGDVNTIGVECFKEAPITSVTIPSTVKSLDRGAFYGCDQLQRVTIEEGVQSIGDSAFSTCKKLNSVVIPPSVVEIGEGAFSDCDSLVSISVLPGNHSFFFNDGVLYNHDSTRLIQYLSGRKSDTYDMPFTVKAIDSYAFWGADRLSSIQVSNQIEKIEPYTFTNCTGLSEIYLPESVTYVDTCAFSSCKNLTYVGLENNYVEIHENAFYQCGEGLMTDVGVRPPEDDSTTAELFASEEGAASKDTTSDKEEEKAETKLNLEIPIHSIQNRKEVDMNLPDGLIGASKIVGGNALVILNDSDEATGRDKSQQKNNTISDNESTSGNFIRYRFGNKSDSNNK